MNDRPLATRPDTSFSVLASAGTGKTWQLVARITRLLLHGAALDSILAITFTRKAAGEMQERLNQRLRELLQADDTQLDALLEDIGESPDEQLRNKARRLLESCLLSERRLRTMTFHSFCQELLQRFPLEAGLPPAFELAEQTGLLIQESWDALFAEATRLPDGPVANALECLFDNLNGLHNTRSALFDFIDYRSDWWAYTQGSADPVRRARDILAERLQVNETESPHDVFWNRQAREELSEFARLLACHRTKTNSGWLKVLEETLGLDDATAAVAQLMPVFFTGKGERRKRSSSKVQRKAMGEAGEDRFLAINETLCTQLEQLIEYSNRQRTLTVNTAWYRAGQRMLAIYQRIKRERRLLDFADLEWNTYLLLNDAEHAHWIQYKLDQRIDHLLIDEFQDTNPTQWRLIVPLLEEMAASHERARSLFVVGDSKQSIYRFRRGNPALLGQVSEWMRERLQAETLHLDHSWRSSQVVNDFVNRVFAHAPLQGLLSGFQRHSTHRTEAWGRVEVWPLFGAGTTLETAVPEGLRNPLHHARPVSPDDRYYREGEAIATRIRELVMQNIAGYDDIILLMRSRTHLSDYEAALRDAGIPYLSLDRGTLLQSLEIRDLEALLIVLMTPQDNLSLAQVLRSPIFSATDDELVLLAQESGPSWFDRLTALAPRLQSGHRLQRAARLLGEWRSLAGHVPIHDLLERIFHQANLPERYAAAFPAVQSARVRANLSRFIELALEVDAGRYPTLPRFLERLGQLRTLDKEGPSQATPHAADGQRVCLLTIHAAKGLEAPVVFLADSTNAGNTPPGCQPLVQWPAESERPTDFMLLGNTARRDGVSRTLYEQEQAEQQRESANLLYVALTRAKHMLVISGCAASGNRATSGWYQQLCEALEHDVDAEQAWTAGEVQPRPPRSGTTPAPPQQTDIPASLRQPLRPRVPWREIAPSRQSPDMRADDTAPEGRLRGIAVHRMLQLANEASPAGVDAEAVINRVAAELQWECDRDFLLPLWQEVSALLDDSRLAWLFAPAADTRAYNEVPIQYRLNDKTVYGIIDRLLVTETQTFIIDYKSHGVTDELRLREMAGHFRPQLELYAEGVRRLWPDREQKVFVLFTATGLLVDIDHQAGISATRNTHPV